MKLRTVTQGFVLFGCILSTLDVAAQKTSSLEKQTPATSKREASGVRTKTAIGKNTAKADKTDTPAAKPRKDTTEPAKSARTDEKKPAKIITTKESSRKEPAIAKQTAAAGPAKATANPPARTFKGDVYGLAALVFQRWSFVEMLPTSQEVAAIRIDSIRRRVSRMADALTALSRVAERRNLNVRNAAAAAYLLQMSHSARPCYLSGPSDVADTQIAALSTTMRDDVRSIDALMETYSPLREALNHSAEELRIGEVSSDDPPSEYKSSDWRPAHTIAPTSTERERKRFAVTVALADLAQERTTLLLAERVPAVEELKTVLEAEGIARTEEHRQTLASFAPAPPRPAPEYSPLIDPGTPIPTDVGSRRSRPDPAPVVERPQERGIVLPAQPGTAIIAATDGTVAFAGEIRGYGKALILQHTTELFSVYAYLSGFNVAEGDIVTTGQPVAHVGVIPGTETGAVRFEVRRGRVAAPISDLIGPADPASKILKR